MVRSGGERAGARRWCGFRLLLRSQRYERDVPPPVFAALEVDGCREAAAFAISSVVDAKALTDLLRATGQTSAAVRRTAINVIARTVSGMPGDERHRWIAYAIPPLVAGLRDTDKDVRYAAAMAFETLASDTAAGVPALARALDDPSRGVRWRVLQALTAIGSQARSAGPALLKALGSPLPPQEGPATGLTDEAMVGLVQAAIAATGAGKDDAKLAAEDEVRAAVVAHVVTRDGVAAGAPAPFAVTVMASRTVPPGLLRALDKRDLAPAGDGVPPRVTIRLGEVTWRAGDLAFVEVNTDYGMSGGMGGCTVVLDGRAWRVVACPMGSWN